MSEPQWHIYMVRTASGHLYTGITTDVARRFSEHECGKGAKYLRGKGPLKLACSQPAGTHSDALKLELMVKKMNKADKERFAAGRLSVSVDSDDHPDEQN